jgi:predicted DNA-binding protein
MKPLESKSSRIAVRISEETKRQLDVLMSLWGEQQSAVLRRAIQIAYDGVRKGQVKLPK